MMNKQELIDAINEYITTNGVQEITGQVMNLILNSIANIIPDDAMLTSAFGGIVESTDIINITPGTSRWFIAKAGSYPNSGGFTFLDKDLNILSYNGVDWDKVVVEMPVGSVNKEDFLNTAAGEMIYNSPMNGTENSPSANSWLINANATANTNGNLSEITVNGNTSGSLEIGVLSRVGNVFTVKNSQIINISTGIKAYPIDLEVGAEDYIGIAISTSSASVKYYGSGSAVGYLGGLSGSSFTSVPAGSISYGFKVITSSKQYPSEIQAFQNDTIAKANTDVNKSLASINEVRGILLYSYPLTANSADFVHNGWNFSSNGATPNAIGLANRLYVNKQINIENKVHRVEVQLQSNSIIALSTVSKEDNYLQSYMTVDAASNTINIYDSMTNITIPTLRASKVLSTVELNGGGKFIVEMYRKARINGIKITNFLTGVSDFLEVTPTQAVHGTDKEVYAGGLQYDCFAISWVGGSAPIFRNICTGYVGKNKPLLYITGDSITYGYGTNDFTKAYAHLIGALTGGNYVLSPRGGGKIAGVIEKITTEVSIIKPEYVMVTIGTNGTPTPGELNTLVNQILAQGAKPIINRIPSRTNGEQTAANDNIAALNLPSCRFDLATAINKSSNPLTANPALYVDAGVHPSTVGFQEMAKRVRIDLPFLF